MMNFLLFQRLAEANGSFAAADRQDFDVEQSAEIDLVLGELNGGFELLIHDEFPFGSTIS